MNGLFLREERFWEQIIVTKNIIPPNSSKCEWNMKEPWSISTLASDIFSSNRRWVTAEVFPVGGRPRCWQAWWLLLAMAEAKDVHPLKAEEEEWQGPPRSQGYSTPYPVLCGKILWNPQNYTLSKIKSHKYCLVILRDPLTFLFPNLIWPGLSKIYSFLFTLSLFLTFSHSHTLSSPSFPTFLPLLFSSLLWKLTKGHLCDKKFNQHGTLLFRFRFTVATFSAFLWQIMDYYEARNPSVWKV